MFSSGDDGVGAGNCQTNDGTKTERFQPNFPASCKIIFSFLPLHGQSPYRNDLSGPFVTTVGGTVKVNPEVAVSFSGGGFSNYFAQPSYQTTAVSTFLTGLGTKFSGMFK